MIVHVWRVRATMDEFEVLPDEVRLDAWLLTDGRGEWLRCPARHRSVGALG
ncbi:hypothetical protein ABZ916_24615 [Streptomyces sp. NPDC046853]|uniref:hypothetical protein n=1 Tax=Streptomyces sp. NPDC046853 TaxID=3154920 RepID=UPI0033E9B9EE